jgi:glycerol-3-phosphate dehydrogenase
LELTKRDPDLATPFVEGLAPIRAEVVLAARNEMDATIEDVIVRRIGLQLYGCREAVRGAPAVAELPARELGWTEIAKREAITEYQAKNNGWMRKSGTVTSP